MDVSGKPPATVGAKWRGPPDGKMSTNIPQYQGIYPKIARDIA
jgi:hypothetical protein